MQTSGEYLRKAIQLAKEAEGIDEHREKDGKIKKLALCLNYLSLALKCNDLDAEKCLFEL